MSGVFLTTKEIENIKISYEHYGPEKIDEFLQAVWKEAFEEGYAKARQDQRIADSIQKRAQG